MIISATSLQSSNLFNITSVSPDSYRNHILTEIVIRGTGFTPDSEVMLHRGKSGESEIQATPGKAYSVAISGSYAYVADGGIGLKVIEIPNPFHPVLAGTYDTTGNILGVAVSGRYVFVADGYSGIQIMRIIPTPCPSVIYVNPSTLEVTVPAMLPAGFYDVVIKNPDGETARLPRGFQSFSLSREAWPGSSYKEISGPFRNGYLIYRTSNSGGNWILSRFNVRELAYN